MEIAKDIKDIKDINVIVTKQEYYDKPFNEFYEIIRNNPSEIITPKYEYLSMMFPREYIKGLKIYIDMLNSDLNNLKKVLRIRSKL
jgi:Txe/YoeB family toxin of Txe-Axe toxin-antitoxin module